MVLRKDKILKPRAKTIQDFGKYVSGKFLKYSYDWSNRTVMQILKNREYLGHMVCNKNSTKSFKNKKLIALPEDQWIVVKNTHEPIIDEETFLQAQKTISVKRKSVKEIGTYQMFIGLLRCSDCGMTISYARAREKNGSGQYACCTYRRYGKTYCSMHYISYKNLYDIVLKDIQEQAQNARLDTSNLLAKLAELDDVKTKKGRVQSEKEILKAVRRIEELNVIVKRLYEDNVLGKINDERFMLLSKDYEAEQSLKAKINTLKDEVCTYDDKKANAEKFTETIAKYCNITELNAETLNELIDKIVIHECEYIDGQRTQKIEINYNFVGIILNTY